MAISIDWGTKVIYVPKADLILVQSSPEVRELNLNQFHLWLKDLEDSEEGMPFPDTHRHNTEVELSGLVYARIIEIINGYTVEFEDGQYTVNCVGANHNLSDVKVPNQVSLIVNNAAGLISNSAIEFASFNERVTIDVTSDYDGTLFPTGTLQQPVNNIPDAVQIAKSRGLQDLYFYHSATITNAHNIAGYIVDGIYHDRSTISIESGAVITGTQFNNVSISGYLNSQLCVMENCSLKNLYDLNANVYNSELDGAMVLDLGNHRHWIECYSNQTTENPPVLDFNNIDQDLALAGYTGNLKISNFSGGNLNISLNSGILEIDSSCSGGFITIVGIGNLIDNSTGTTIYSDGLVNEDLTNIPYDVWTYSDRTLTQDIIASGGGLTQAEHEQLFALDTSTLSSQVTVLEASINDVLGLSGENVKWSAMSFDSNHYLTSAVITQYTNNTLTVVRKQWQLTATYNGDGELTSYQMKEL